MHLPHIYIFVTTDTLHALKEKKNHDHRTRSVDRSTLLFAKQKKKKKDLGGSVCPPDNFFLTQQEEGEVTNSSRSKVIAQK